jgi:hypothetical protein
MANKDMEAELEYMNLAVLELHRAWGYSQEHGRDDVMDVDKRYSGAGTGQRGDWRTGGMRGRTIEERRVCGLASNYYKNTNTTNYSKFVHCMCWYFSISFLSFYIGPSKTATKQTRDKYAVERLLQMKWAKNTISIIKACTGILVTPQAELAAVNDPRIW